MTQKEKNKISISISTFLAEALRDDVLVEDVANSAICLCVDLMKNFPDIKCTTSDIMNSLEWDEMISWIRFEKEKLS